MIERFHVNNYKLLKDVEASLTPIHVVIGQNDTGKTCLLEAILAFCRSAEPERLIRSVFAGKWLGRELVHFRAPEPEIEFAADLSEPSNREPFALGYGFTVRFGDPVSETCFLTSEEIHDGGRREVPLNNPNLSSVAHRHTLPPKNYSEFGLDRIADALTPVGFYRLDARLMAVPASIDENRKFRMDPDGFGLATLLDDILGYDPSIFLELSREFCEFFPEFKRVRIETQAAQQRTFDPTGIHNSSRTNGKGISLEMIDGGSIRAQQASDGVILFLGFLALLYTPTPPKILLIEEPEKGVYPKRLAEIIGLLRKLTDARSGRAVPQIIFTTHSPYVLSHFQPEEVTLMSRRGDHAIARPLRDAPHIMERLGDGEFYLGELWYNLDEEELFHDARADHPG